MERIVKQNLLFDFYGDLLTKHQRDVYMDAVFNDMSLSEVAEEYGITRQAAHDLIKRVDRILENYEYRLRMIERSRRIKYLTEEARLALSENDKESLLEIISEIDSALA